MSDTPPVPAPYADTLRRAMIPELLRAEDVALALGVGVNGARQRLARGDLGPTLRLGKRVYIRREVLLRALASRERQVPQDPPRPVPPSPDPQILGLLDRRRGGAR